MTPQRIAIVGGHGKVALQLLPILLERGHEVVSLARRDEQLAALADMGASPRLLDIEAATPEDYAQALSGCDAVVFSAGGGPDGNAARKQTVDLGGALATIEAAKANGIARVVQVSAIAVDIPLAAGVDPVWKAYVEAKRDADAALRHSGLDWTILRPGRLTDDPATGMVELAMRVERAEISRADVALVAAECLERSDTIGHQWELVGGETPVAEALDVAVR